MSQSSSKAKMQIWSLTTFSPSEAGVAVAVAFLLEQTVHCDNGSCLPHTSISKLLHTTNNWPQYKVQLLPQITCFNYLLEIQSLFRLNSFWRAVSTPLILLDNTRGLCVSFHPAVTPHNQQIMWVCKKAFPTSSWVWVWFS